MNEKWKTICRTTLAVPRIELQEAHFIGFQGNPLTQVRYRPRRPLLFLLRATLAKEFFQNLRIHEILIPGSREFIRKKILL